MTNEDPVFKHINVNERSDSIEIGTPAKGGALKVYFDTDKPEEAQARIRQAFALRQLARELQGEQ